MWRTKQNGDFKETDPNFKVTKRLNVADLVHFLQIGNLSA